LKIDLQTQGITRVNDVQNKLKLDGWELLLWPTGKEAMTADQLVEILNGPDGEAHVATDELLIRARESDDWLTYTRLLIDPRINAELRFPLALNLSLYGKRYVSHEVLGSIAQGLNDPDPQTQLSAAALLSRYAANPPGKYVRFRRVSDPEFSAEHMKHVPLFRKWWVAGTPRLSRR
jgi:hypothetical protein